MPLKCSFPRRGKNIGQSSVEQGVGRGQSHTLILAFILLLSNFKKKKWKLGQSDSIDTVTYKILWTSRRNNSLLNISVINPYSRSLQKVYILLASNVNSKCDPSTWRPLWHVKCQSPNYKRLPKHSLNRWLHFIHDLQTGKKGGGRGILREKMWFSLAMKIFKIALVSVH